MTAGTVVIGIGHPYRSDDAVGLAVLDLLVKRQLAHLTLVIGSGEPTELIDAWHDASTAILVDALYHPHAEPGRIHHLTLDDPTIGKQDLPMAASSHDIGLGHTIALAQALDRLPRRLVLYAIEVADVGFGDGLSAPVAAAARTVADQIHDANTPYGPGHS